MEAICETFRGATGKRILSNMRMQLGVKRGTVRLIAYQQDWPILFEQEKAMLLGIFQKTALQIEHIGSTSVPGLKAKPILDLSIQIANFPLSILIAKDLIRQGYSEVIGRFADPDHLVYAKGNQEIITHLLHVVNAGNPAWDEHIRFRDYLRQNSSERDRYARLKEQLAARYALDRSSYTASKSAFIAQILRKAGDVL